MTYCSSIYVFWILASFLQWHPFPEIQTFWWYVRSTSVSSLSLFPSDYFASLISVRPIHSTVYLSNWLSELILNAHTLHVSHRSLLSSPALTAVYGYRPGGPVLSASESWLQLLRYHGISIFVLKMQPHFSNLSLISFLVWLVAMAKQHIYRVVQKKPHKL